MKIPYDFLENILEIPGLRLQAFENILRLANPDIGDDAVLAPTLVYAHLLKYAPAELSASLVANIFRKHAWKVHAIAIVNKHGVISNGEVLWDIASGAETDPGKLQGIYEQHGLDLDEYTTLVEETYRDISARQAQRRNAGAPRAGAVPAPSGAPAGSPSSQPVPASA
jgi:hypothetical protein